MTSCAVRPRQPSARAGAPRDTATPAGSTRREHDHVHARRPRAYRFLGRIRLGAEFLRGAARETSRVMVSPTEHTDKALLLRAYLLLQAYASLRFRAEGKWRLKSGGSRESPTRAPVPDKE
jgi:hypothetical protein